MVLEFLITSSFKKSKEFSFNLFTKHFVCFETICISFMIYNCEITNMLAFPAYLANYSNDRPHQNYFLYIISLIQHLYTLSYISDCIFIDNSLFNDSLAFFRRK